MREEMRLGLLRTGCSGKYLNVKDGKERENGKYCIMRSFIICTLHAVS
jgi:hypothetical protein